MHDDDTVVVSSNTSTTEAKDTAKADDKGPIQNDDTTTQEKDNAAAKSGRRRKRRSQHELKLPRAKGPKMKLSKNAKWQRTQQRVERRRAQRGQESRFPIKLDAPKYQKTFLGRRSEPPIADYYQRHKDNIAQAKQPNEW